MARSSSDQRQLTRRDLLRHSALALAGGAALSRTSAASAAPAVRIALPSPGSGGSVWRPLVEQGGYGASLGVDLHWIGGNPGQVELQLLSGALDVSTFGAVGASEAAAHGSDVVIFGPALNNHGRWIVRGNSAYHDPRDLIGKRIAAQPETSETFLQARIAAALHGIDIKRDMEIVYGPPLANLALFDRGDVEAVIVMEPTATRLVAAGAREIARVADMWRSAMGSDLPPFLVGLSAQRAWVEANRATAAKLTALFISIHREIHRRPERLAELHEFMGVPASEPRAIELLPQRLVDIYPVEWGPSVFAAIDRQVETAVKVGILAARPGRPLYETV
jgi:ABC-type nitrate/sulfonate/bicarbonate transport system substrate-binding protein